MDRRRAAPGSETFMRALVVDDSPRSKPVKTFDNRDLKTLEVLMGVVENQLKDDDPPEARLTLERLKKEGLSELEAKRLMRSLVATEITSIIESKQPFNKERYVQALKRLPKLPWEE